MIDTAPMRAAMNAAAGDDMIVDKATLTALFDEIDAGQRRPHRRRAAAPDAGIGRVSALAA